MNTPGSVAYGWGALVVAAGAAYYMARGTIDERKRAATARGDRPLEIKSWQDRIAESERLVTSSTLTPDPSSKAAQQAALLGNPGVDPAPGEGVSSAGGGLGGGGVGLGWERGRLEEGKGRGKFERGLSQFEV